MCARQSVTDSSTHFLEYAADLLGIGITSGVGKADLIATRLDRSDSHAHHLVFADRTFERATEHRRQAGFNDRPFFLGQAVAEFADFLRAGDGFIRRHPHIGQAVRLGYRNRQRQFVYAGCHRALRTAKIRRQCRDIQPGDRQCMRNDFSGIRHLRDQLRRHEGADFDFAQSGCRGRADPFLFVFGRHELLGVLQTVAWPYFTDQNIDVAVHHCRSWKIRTGTII